VGSNPTSSSDSLSFASVWCSICPLIIFSCLSLHHFCPRSPLVCCLCALMSLSSSFSLSFLSLSQSIDCMPSLSQIDRSALFCLHIPLGCLLLRLLLDRFRPFSALRFSRRFGPFLRSEWYHWGPLDPLRPSSTSISDSGKFQILVGFRVGGACLW
jgi:hypothetical protein